MANPPWPAKLVGDQSSASSEGSPSYNFPSGQVYAFQLEIKPSADFEDGVYYTFEIPGVTFAWFRFFASPSDATVPAALLALPLGSPATGSLVDVSLARGAGMYVTCDADASARTAVLSGMEMTGFRALVRRGEPGDPEQYILVLCAPTSRVANSSGIAPRLLELPPGTAETVPIA